jgi:glycosyltransferase involved in cell wall biosynthesis
MSGDGLNRTDTHSGDIALSVLIPTFNRSEVLQETLRRLALQSVAVPWEVVVINNRCSDDTDAAVAGFAPIFPCTLRIVHEERPGASAARNHGVRSARGTLLVFLDDDIWLDPGALQRAVADHAACPNLWFVARVLPLPEHLSTPFGAFLAAVDSHPPATDGFPEIEAFASGFAVVPRASLLQLGGYNEDYPTAALEDADMYIRAHAVGIKVCYDPDLVGTHNDWAGATLRDFCHRQRMYCQTAPLLARRFDGECHPWSALIAANSPPQQGFDGVAVIVRKRLKSLLSHRAPMAALFWTADLFEHPRCRRRLLWSVYRVTIAASMYGGFQEGVEQMNTPPTFPQIDASLVVDQ